MVTRLNQYMRKIALLGPPLVGKRTLLLNLADRRHGKVKYQVIDDVVNLLHLERKARTFWARKTALSITAAIGHQFRPKQSFRLVLEGATGAFFAFTVPFEEDDLSMALELQMSFYEIFLQVAHELHFPEEAIRILLTKADLLAKYPPPAKELEELIDLRISSVTGEGLDDFMKLAEAF